MKCCSLAVSFGFEDISMILMAVASLVIASPKYDKNFGHCEHPLSNQQLEDIAYRPNSTISLLPIITLSVFHRFW